MPTKDENDRRTWSAHLDRSPAEDWDAADMLAAAIKSIDNADKRLAELHRTLSSGQSRAS